MVSCVVSPPKGRRPPSISYSTTPNEKRSLRASVAPPRACSGDMYATVPITTPGVVARLRVSPLDDSSVRTFAIPKSRILTTLSRVMNTFSGFRSRWTMPRSCAAASPRAICSA